MTNEDIPALALIESENSPVAKLLAEKDAQIAAQGTSLLNAWDYCESLRQDAERYRWLPIETAPESGSYMVHEDGACRLKLRHDGQWHDIAYAAIECTLTGEVAVGQDAQRVLDMRATAGAYRLVVRDGSCENPTHWMPLPAPPDAAPERGQSTAGPI